MKIAEYKQMMEYLTRPGFNGGGSVRNKTILPKKKPEEEVIVPQDNWVEDEEGNFYKKE